MGSTVELETSTYFRKTYYCYFSEGARIIIFRIIQHYSTLWDHYSSYFSKIYEYNMIEINFCQLKLILYFILCIKLFVKSKLCSAHFQFLYATADSRFRDRRPDR